MPDLILDPQQQADADHLFAVMQPLFLDEAQHLARLLASKADSQLLGRTEFEVRDAIHRLGARALETALSERKQRGIKARA